MAFQGHRTENFAIGGRNGWPEYRMGVWKQQASEFLRERGGMPMWAGALRMTKG